jgi:prepilin-type N-terminal cleavage/methylation domain-containing protein
MARKGFSLIELIITIAIIAIVAGVSSMYLFGVLKASNNATDKRNAQMWNEIYSNVVGADPALGNLSWNEISAELANGLNVQVGTDHMRFLAAKPAFSKGDTPTFVPGVGITKIPGEE